MACGSMSIDLRRPRSSPDPLLPIIIKLLAFALGCLISVAVGLYEAELSTTQQAPLVSPQNVDAVSN